MADPLTIREALHVIAQRVIAQHVIARHLSTATRDVLGALAERSIDSVAGSGTRRAERPRDASIQAAHRCAPVA